MGNGNLGTGAMAQESGLPGGSSGSDARERNANSGNPQFDADRAQNARRSFEDGVAASESDAQRDGDRMMRDQLARDENHQIDPAAERGGGRIFIGQDARSDDMISTSGTGGSNQDDATRNFGSGAAASRDADMQQGGLGSSGQGADGSLDDQGEEGRDR